MRIAPSEFIHPEDEAALANLRAVPLFDTALKALLKISAEELMHGLNMAQKVRLNEQQLPEIYGHLPAICGLLGIDEPEFYLEMNPLPNAYTYGDTRICITVTSGLVEMVEMVEPGELHAVIAHECGHILCRHVLYHTLAYYLSLFGSRLFGLTDLVTQPLQLALLYWSRRSEFSADRAAALVCGGAQDISQVMARLAGGPKSITARLDLELYAQQADAYDKLLDGQWDKLLQNAAVMNMDHPLTAVRLREARRWCAGDDFPRLNAALHDPSAHDGSRCEKCGVTIGAGWKFCKGCGTPVH